MHASQTYTVQTAGAWTEYFEDQIAAMSPEPDLVGGQAREWLQLRASVAAGLRHCGPGDWWAQCRLRLTQAGLDLGLPPRLIKDAITRAERSTGDLEVREDAGREWITFTVAEVIHYLSDRPHTGESRWREVEIVRTQGGSYVVRSSHVTRFQGEQSLDLYWVFPTQTEALFHMGQGSELERAAAAQLGFAVEV